MRNIKLVIQYDGTKYSGWQKRPGDEKSIQYKLENVISRMLDAKIEIIGSGRTDKGVHATMQVANFHEPKYAVYFSLGEMIEYINAHLPKDIAVISITEADERFHSRLNCTAKKYIYRIDNRKVQDVFQSKFRTHVTPKLNVKAMKQAAEHFVGEYDFTSFANKKSKSKSAIREIYSLEISEKGGFIDMEVRGNGFLYNMVRIIAGTLIEVGHGKKKASDIRAILEAKERALAGYTAPAEGLVLDSVEY